MESPAAPSVFSLEEAGQLQGLWFPEPISKEGIEAKQVPCGGGGDGIGAATLPAGDPSRTPTPALLHSRLPLGLFSLWGFGFQNLDVRDLKR